MKRILTLAPLALSAILGGCITDKSSSSESTSSSSATSLNNDNCGSMVLAVGSDFTAKSGKLYATSLDSAKTCQWNLSIYDDAQIKTYGSYAYVLEAMGSDKIDKIKIATGTVVYQAQLPANSNPQDMAFIDSNTAIVTLQNSKQLLKVNLNNGTVIDSLNLSAYAASGTTGPSAQSILLGTDGHVYVALQRLDTSYQSHGAKVLAIDPTTFKIIDSITLQSTNPYRLAQKGSSIYAIDKGNSTYDASYNETSLNDGGIELLNFSSHSTQILMNESALKGKPVDLVFDKNGKAYVSIYASYGNVSVAQVDVDAKTLGTALPGITNAQGGIAYLASQDQVFASQSTGTTAILSFGNLKNIQTFFSGMLAPYSLTLRP